MPRQASGVVRLRLRGRIEVPYWGETETRDLAKFGRPVQLVILHGGREMDVDPSSFEHVYAEAAAEGGAAAVAFHGSHVAHTVEMVAGVPVHFGLGNLLFDQRDPRAARGQVVLFRFRPGALAEVMETRCVEASKGQRCKSKER